ncbi:hypothetical protein TH8_08525 [Thalassospira profundimaris]|nr:hypothetical protein TH8_08525 [Thalassospira profundimaris]
MTEIVRNGQAQPRLIILGAGGRANGSRPAAVQKVTIHRQVLDWQIDAFKAIDPVIEFVGGYKLSEVTEVFPHLNFHFNPEWMTGGSIGSLNIALNAIVDSGQAKDVYVIYGDILLKPEAVKKFISAMSSDRVCVGVSHLRREADRGRGKRPEVIQCNGEFKEFIGFVKIPAAYLREFCALIANDRHRLNENGMSFLFSRDVGVPFETIDCDLLWAHTEINRSVAEFILGSKASTLKSLQGKLKSASVLPVFYFNHEEWTAASSELIETAISKFTGEKHLVVRSSAVDEDGFKKANAGKYRSELNVLPETKSIRDAVERVFSSYGDVTAKDEVLIQPQLSDVRASGVVFTRQLGTGAPYYVVNYSLDGSTTTITSGEGPQGEKFTVLRNRATEKSNLPPLVRAVIQMAQELEQCAFHDALDIEFAVDHSDNVTVLQCRPLMVSDERQDRVLDDNVSSIAAKVENALEQLEAPALGVVGQLSCWSVMADWNPAEIIGPTPSPLSLSLYRYIITDRTWSIQRKEVGGRDVTHLPLLRSFGGQAFIDVRASVNSFIPATLSDDIARRIVEYGLKRLRKHPELHDKIEFEIVPTCLDMSFAGWRNDFTRNGALEFHEVDQLEEGLRNTTRKILERVPSDLCAAKKLEGRAEEILSHNLSDGEWIGYVLDICRDQGALTFSHLARAGFVAVALLKSFVKEGILDCHRYDQCINSFETISSIMQREAWQVKNGEKERGAFINKFGHIRPGTYDLMIASYADNPETYFDPMIKSAIKLETKPFVFTKEETAKIDRALLDLDIGLDSKGMLDFAFSAISGREYSKFVFTKFISAVLARIAQLEPKLGVAKADLQYLSVDVLKQLGVEIWDNERDFLINCIEFNKKRFNVSQNFVLPPVVFDKSNVAWFKSPETEENFITLKKASGTLCIVNSDAQVSSEMLKGAIVAIRNADPGYDFLFGMSIAGFITAYGGPNSHMAIRAAEFGLPAVIGIGEEKFSALKDGVHTEVDCQSKRWEQINV